MCSGPSKKNQEFHCQWACVTRGQQGFLATVWSHGLRYNRFQYIPVRGLAPS